MKNKLPVVVAVLRLSSKYLAPTLRKQAISLLVTAYPCDYDAWKHREANRLVTAIANELSVLVILAEQTDVRVILPSVFYSAAKRPLEDVLRELYSMPLSDAVRQTIITKFLIGREKLRREEMKDVLTFFQPTFPRPDCQNTDNCNKILLNYTSTVLSRLTDAEPYQDYCINKPSTIGQSIGVCSKCSDTIRDHVENATKRIWGILPDLFGLPAWEVMKASDDIQD